MNFKQKLCYIGLVLVATLGLTGDRVHSQQARLVFSGFPWHRLTIVEPARNGVLETLTDKIDTQLEYTCIIEKTAEDKYVWTSREKKQMTKSKSGNYVTFTALDGSGYVKIDRTASVDTSKLNYVEHIPFMLTSINYWGKTMTYFDE